MTELELFIDMHTSTNSLALSLSKDKFTTKIYYPKDKTKSIYGDEDQDILYSEEADIEGLYVVTGLLSEVASTLLDSNLFSSYLQSTPILYYDGFTESTPISSLVEIYLGDSKFKFKVHNNPVVNGNDNTPLYQKLYLSPIN